MNINLIDIQGLGSDQKIKVFLTKKFDDFIVLDPELDPDPRSPN